MTGSRGNSVEDIERVGYAFHFMLQEKRSEGPLVKAHSRVSLSDAKKAKKTLPLRTYRYTSRNKAPATENTPLTSPALLEAIAASHEPETNEVHVTKPSEQFQTAPLRSSAGSKVPYLPFEVEAALERYRSAFSLQDGQPFTSSKDTSIRAAEYALRDAIAAALQRAHLANEGWLWDRITF